MTSATNPGTPTRSSAGRTSPLTSLIEYFTLRRDGELVARVDERARRAIADALALGRQRSDAADTLWANGHTAEGLRLAGSALDATLTAAPTLARSLQLDAAVAPAPPVTEAAAEDPTSAADAELEVDAEAEVDAAAEVDAEAAPAAPVARVEAPVVDERALRATVLRARGASDKEIETIEAARAAFHAASLPLLDAEISPAHGDLYQQVTHARHTADRRLASAALDRRALVFTRVARTASAVLLAVGALTATYFLTRKPEYTVHASAVWADAPAYDQDKAVDGRTDTWWLVPDGQPGWLEVRFSSPHHIERVRMLNTSNAPHHDRGTNQYRLELYGEDGQVLRSIDGDIPFRPDPQWVEQQVDLDGVMRIRFVVVSHHRTSAGLSELEWQ
ncbi:hypothetical protein [Sandaracinus amylolyticus]|uniref:F5/8 type C domain-containing protein n=1 Tax=Sandaracinus amylolyticus TaxID=927083 RepID=A0A0F6SEW3_9BACT|nr:hypothetical protein [Sandaracinus amylolyticus]AKF05894.1 hypothetical protein DB32_003043 [Sandaracinus amylolyticus]